MNPDRPLLFNYFRDTTNLLLAEYERSKGQQASKNIGHSREAFCKHFLENVIPHRFNVHQGGEILDDQGHNTGEVDITIVRDDCPKLNFGELDAFLAEGVFAVIDVKSNLKRDKMKEALDKLYEVKKLEPKIHTIMKSGFHLDRPFRAVLAYEGATFETILDEIRKYPDDDVVDYIGILNKGAIVREGHILEWEEDTPYQIVKGKSASIGFLYFILIQYSVCVMARNINLSGYFTPLNRWE